MFALAGITKEFAPPVLMALGLIAIFSGQVPRTQIGKRLTAVAIGSLIAVVANASFNVLRFGVPYNQILLDPLSPSAALRAADFLCGARPNGGLLFFWASFVAVLVSVVVHDWRSLAAKAPVYWVVCVLAALTFGLSGWWAPFGWIAWGPRLLLPWIPACLLILLRAHPSEALVRAAENGRHAVIVTILAIAGLSQFSALYGLELIHSIFGSAPGCPSIPTDPVNQADG